MASKGRMSSQKKKVRREIFLTGGIVLALFVSMILYMCIYAATHEQNLFTNDYNSREEILLDKNVRGNIYSADGQVLATTKIGDDGSEIRQYPFGRLFSHIVGYAAEGGSGIEIQYDYDLVHSDISLAEKAECDEAGKKYPGNDVYTTLSVPLQQAAENAIGMYKGAILVTEVKTGKVLAMVSKPDFEPGEISANWDMLLRDSESGTLVNRATQGLYPPGSAFKIFDAIEFMQENMTAADNYSYDCQGYTTIEGETINCYHWTVHGTVDLKESFAHSCNSSFVTIGTQYIDPTQFTKTLSTMMFNEQLPYELPSMKSRYVLDASTTMKERLQLAIGQGQTLMTPLHVNMITAAIANGGTVYTPYVVTAVETATGKILSSKQPTAYRTVMTPEIAAKMREMMRAVVENGTAAKMNDRPYNAAGKTGSAEFMNNKSDSHAWFTGFAPMEDPEIAVTVIVEGAGSGGSYAVPVARRVFDAYFGYQGDDSDVSDSYWTTPSTNDASAAAPVTTATDSTAAAGTDAAGTGAAQAVPQIAGEVVVEERPENTVQLNLDTNGDGVPDAIDTDGDGKPEMYDRDGDGIPETYAESRVTEEEMAAQAAQTAEPAPADAAEEDEPVIHGMEPIPEDQRVTSGQASGGVSDNMTEAQEQAAEDVLSAIEGNTP